MKPTRDRLQICRPRTQRRGQLVIVAALLCEAWMGSATSVAAQQLLPGEFGEIQLDRELVEPARLPTVSQLREAVARPASEPVLLLRLHGGDDHATLPVWSDDGRRLAFLRSNVDANSSKLLVFHRLSEAAPQQITDQPRLYDYMFRWAVGGDGSFVFTRINADTNATQIHFGGDGQPIETKTKRPGAYGFPALFERTDGIWRLVYEAGGQLMHQAWNADGEVEPAVAIGRGSAARWSRDGRRLLMLSERPRSGRLAAMDLIVRDLRRGADAILPTPGAATIRGPVWSPDESRIAFFVRDAGDDQPWRIDLGSADAASPATTVADDVVVNRDFTSEGPAFSPDGQQIWFFSQRNRSAANYPLVAIDLRNGQQQTVPYHQQLTAAGDVAVNPATVTPEIAFVANDGDRRDLYVVFLNHF